MGTHQLAPGTVLGRYELLLPIASGGMATVWVARLKGSRGFSKTVAVKTILPSLSDDPTFEQMFLDEATLASKIQHPNVAQIIDLGEEDEVLFLAMEWVDGESLSTLSKFSRKNGTDIPLRVGLKIISQAAAGLHAAHELTDEDDRLLELVHRDVSPQNILVSSTGLVKIVDFGVAKAMGRGGETTAGQLKGKVPFMSPEQARGAKVDRRTDIFALGIILYRLATGAHPFLDDSDVRTMRNIITRPVMPPRVKNPSLSTEIERVILRALAKDPEKRPQTAAELEVELEAAIAASPSVGGPIHLDEIGTFVRSTLGERDRKRRAAIRDAALKIDEQATLTTTGSNPPESLSGVMFTRMQTPPRASSPRLASGSGSESADAPRKPEEVTEARAYDARTVRASAAELLAEVAEARAAQASRGASEAARAPDDASDVGLEGLITRVEPLSLARPALPSEPPLASSPTLAAVASAPDSLRREEPRRSKKVLAFVAVAASLALGVGAAIVLSSGDSVDGKVAAAPKTQPAALPPSPSAIIPASEENAIDLASLPDQATAQASTSPSDAPASPRPSREPSREASRETAREGASTSVASTPVASPSAPAKVEPTSPKKADVPPPVASTKPKPVETSVPVVQTPGF
jgi:eukaryotic-like serine/threonine-protein kinase